MLPPEPLPIDSAPLQVRALVDELLKLNILEFSDLTKILAKRLGVPDQPMMPMGMAMAAPAGGAPAASPAAEPAEEKTSFTVKLESFDAAAKIKVIKEVRAVTGLGLKEAKELVSPFLLPSMLPANPTTRLHSCPLLCQSQGLFPPPPNSLCCPAPSSRCYLHILQTPHLLVFKHLYSP